MSSKHSKVSKSLTTGLLWDKRLLKHEEKSHNAERPQRALFILQELEQKGVLDRMKMVHAREATRKELKLVHSDEHIDQLNATSKVEYGGDFGLDNDTYFNKHSAKTARLAVGGLIDFVEKVYTGKLKNGFAVVRPPGHHASCMGIEGFCLLNNVAIAAKCLQQKHNVERIMIVDWDVHHGNGTQEVFYNDKSVLYLSIHYWQGHDFYPYTGAMADIGTGDGVGRNINVPLTEKGFGDDMYLSIFKDFLIPVAKEFKPEMILVSSGFDAAKGEKTGIQVTPHGFAWMTKELMKLNSKLVLALEGGYYATPLRRCAVACCQTLLGDEISELPYKPEIVYANTRMSRAQKKKTEMQRLKKLKYLLKNHWKCFKNAKKLSHPANEDPEAFSNEVRIKNRKRKRGGARPTLPAHWTPPRVQTRAMKIPRTTKQPKPSKEPTEPQVSKPKDPQPKAKPENTCKSQKPVSAPRKAPKTQTPARKPPKSQTSARKAPKQRVTKTPKRRKNLSSCEPQVSRPNVRMAVTTRSQAQRCGVLSANVNSKSTNFVGLDDSRKEPQESDTTRTPTKSASTQPCNEDPNPTSSTPLLPQQHVNDISSALAQAKLHFLRKNNSKKRATHKLPTRRRRSKSTVKTTEVTEERNGTDKGREQDCKRMNSGPIFEKQDVLENVPMEIDNSSSVSSSASSDTDVEAGVSRFSLFNTRQSVTKGYRCNSM